MRETISVNFLADNSDVDENKHVTPGTENESK